MTLFEPRKLKLKMGLPWSASVAPAGYRRRATHFWLSRWKENLFSGELSDLAQGEILLEEA